jgi:MFS transporter, FSR family, fosmidomycin resistance protein
MSPKVAASTARIALIVAIAHGFTDLYQAVLLPLLPRIMDKLGLSIGLAATASMALALGASLTQPAMGYVADRWGRRVFVVVGPLMSGVFGSLVGWAPGLTALIVLLVLSGLGSAAFHPPAASLSARVEAGKGSGFRYSLFSLGGTIGFALGPLMAVGIVRFWGLQHLWVAMIPVLVACAMFWKMLPPDQPQVRHASLPSPIQMLRQLRGPLGVVFGVSAAGAFVQRSFLTFAPIIASEAGASETAGAVALSVYLAAQAVGTVTGGILADKVDRGRLLGLLTAAAVPAHMLALWLPVGSIGALTFAALSGFLNMAILPPVVVMAQEMVPQGTASSSGIVMGLAWATGSILMLGTGFLGDVIGAQSAALLTVPLLFVGTALTFHPALRPFRRAATAA